MFPRSINADSKTVAPACSTNCKPHLGAILTYSPKSIVLSCTEEGAAIYYTDDGSDPKNSGTQKIYSGSIELPTPDPDQSPRTVTIKAYATKEGMADSEVATFTYGENY